METAEIETSRVVHFSISGEFVTEHARDMVREGNWRGAYNFLMDTMHGMDAQMAMDIVQGKKHLTGVNDLELEDDTREAEVKGWLDFRFRHCFAYKGKVFHPYGYVSSLRREDWHLAREIAAGDDDAMLHNKLWRRLDDELSETPRLQTFSPWDADEVLRWRPAYYARERGRDVCVHLNVAPGEYRAVLFELVEQDVPLWYQLPSAPGDIVREAYAKGWLVDLSEERFPVEPGRAQAVLAAEEAQPDETLAEPLAAHVVAERVRREDTLRQMADDEQQHEQRLAVLRTQIGHFADQDSEYGWLQLDAYDETAGRRVQLRVPHRAFVCAALARARAHHLMPEYDVRCPSGLKMYNDDRYHSEAWVGAGLPPEEAYNDDMPEQRLFMRELYDLQRKLLSCSFDVLARGKQASLYGIVTHDPANTSKEHILVLKTAAPEHASAALKSMAVIVEAGSKLAHLVVVSREDSIPVIRLEDALQRFPEGRRVSINFDSGTVDLIGI
jgi:phosphohistidine swiveling domain-containing protein